MANGVPVIASRVGGLPEIVLHQGTGLLVENNVADASAAITKLMTDKPYAMALGKQGRAMVRDGFTLAHMALRTHHEYKVVLK
jgi:spore coat protein SA